MTQTYWYGWLLSILLIIASAITFKYGNWDTGLALVIAGVCALLASPLSGYLHRAINKDT